MDKTPTLIHLVHGMGCMECVTHTCMPTCLHQVRALKPAVEAALTTLLRDLKERKGGGERVREGMGEGGVRGGRCMWGGRGMRKQVEARGEREEGLSALQAPEKE